MASPTARGVNVVRSRHVLYRLGAELYGFPVGVVREMVRAQPAALVPGSAGCVRGVINLRGTILTLVDTRIALGMKSSLSENEALCELLEQRKRDHEAWMAELERCVTTGEPFTLSVDPHQCAFGSWYDHFKTEHLVLRAALGRLDAPHRAVHATAESALALVRSGNRTAALSLVEERRTHDLADLTGQLSGLSALIRDQQRELVIVVEHQGKTLGLCVDSVEGVEMLPETGQSLGPLMGEATDQQIVLRDGSGHPVQLLPLDRLFSSAGSHAAA